MKVLVTLRNGVIDSIFTDKKNLVEVRVVEFDDDADDNLSDEQYKQLIDGMIEITPEHI